MKTATKLLILLAIFLGILALYRGPMSTGWTLWADILSAFCTTYLIQYIPALRLSK
jgi:hypothetical protein